jgi:hypothetical protein
VPVALLAGDERGAVAREELELAPVGELGADVALQEVDDLLVRGSNVASSACSVCGPSGTSTST